MFCRPWGSKMMAGMQMIVVFTFRGDCNGASRCMHEAVLFSLSTNCTEQMSFWFHAPWTGPVLYHNRGNPEGQGLARMMCYQECVPRSYVVLYQVHSLCCGKCLFTLLSSRVPRSEVRGLR